MNLCVFRWLGTVVSKAWKRPFLAMETVVTYEVTSLLFKIFVFVEVYYYFCKKKDGESKCSGLIAYGK